MEGMSALDKGLNVLIGHELGENHVARIQAVAPGAVIRHVDRDSLAPDDFAWSDIFFGWPPRKLLKHAERLGWVHLPSAGADSYVEPSMYANPDVILTNSSGVFGIPLAEHAFAMMLAFSRSLHHYGRLQAAGRWEKLQESGELYGKTVGILGLGDIGTELAKRANAFGMQVWALKRRVTEKPDYVHRLVGLDGLRDLLAASDYVVIALPLTAKTHRLIGRQEIEWMQSHGILINVGRGPIVDEAALIAALQEGRIAGAGLDVFEQEPLPEDSPLWDMSNVIITPHSGGVTPQAIGRIVEVFCHNLRLWQVGGQSEMINVVDMEAGY